MSSWACLVLGITYTILAFVLYHQMFGVIYFGGVVNGIFKELFICFLFGVIMTGFTLYYWKIALAVVIVAGIGLIITADSTEKRVAFIVLLVIVGIVITVAGKNFKKSVDKKNASNSAEKYGGLTEAEITEADKKQVDITEENLTGLWVFVADDYDSQEDEKWRLIFIDISLEKKNTYALTTYGVAVGDSFHADLTGTIKDKILESNNNTYFTMSLSGKLFMNDEETGGSIPFCKATAKQEQQYEKVKKEVDNNSGDNEDSDMDESDDSEDMEDSDMEDPENLDEGESTDYILPDSDSQYITDDDLYDLSESECKIARNEIYARHGRKFNDASLQEYFDSKDWYEGTIEPEEFDESVLNKYEKKNVKTIAKYETE